MLGGVFGCLEGCSGCVIGGCLGAWKVLGYLDARVVGGSLKGARVLEVLAWGSASTKILGFSWRPKLMWVTQVLFGTNFYDFYSVKLLRYSDLGGK